jgi:hypothetical protein
MQTAILTQQPISVENFKNLLLNFTRSTSISLTYFVDDSRSRTIKGNKQVQKLVRISNNAYLNHDYENKVKKLTGEDFVAEQLKGKTRITSTIIQSNSTAEFMLDIKVLRTEKVELISYYHNGNPITEAEAISMDLWAPAYYNPEPKKTAGRGTVSEEDNFTMITPYISRICVIKFNGTEYLITE